MVMLNIKFDLNELRSNGPLLRKSKLQPGDVLLVRGNTPFSSLIVNMSGGEYSHAAIWIPGGDANFTDLFLAESDTAGVGFTQIIPMGIYQVGRQTAEIVYCIPGNPKAWVLLRHPDCKNIDAIQMRQASIQLQINDFFKTYSPLPRLLETVVLPNSYHIVLKGLAQTFEYCRVDKGTRGTFCSELVATFFSNLGVELFSSIRAPHTVSPNDFLSPDCRLNVVADAFIDTDNLAPGTYGYGSIVQDRKNDPYLRAMIKRRDFTDQLSATVNTIVNNLHKERTKLVEKQTELATIIEDQFIQSIEQAQEWDNSSEVEKLLYCATIYKYGNCLLQCLDENDNRLHSLTTSSEDINSWNEANESLQCIAFGMMYHAQRSLIRIKILSGLRRIREIHSISKPSIVERSKFKHFRLKILKEWKTYKHESNAPSDFQQSLLETDNLSEQAQFYVYDVIQKTCQNLINKSAH